MGAGWGRFGEFKVCLSPCPLLLPKGSLGVPLENTNTLKSLILIHSTNSSCASCVPGMALGTEDSSQVPQFGNSEVGSRIQVS